MLARLAVGFSDYFRYNLIEILIEILAGTAIAYWPQAGLLTSTIGSRDCADRP
ncbi:hypothetical protein [Bradyrhizobium sp. dw_78]|uniref:hypothetical protein n=1 Tax=Bradyrhizobium sp. dw_78 TaxID=2719793 RepID=UPI001BD4B574|nr:hypothetical protein [Bradyrhizobium sp. dw_78]